MSRKNNINNLKNLTGKEIPIWCKNECTGHWYYDNGFFGFENKNDSARFKLWM